MGLVSAVRRGGEVAARRAHELPHEEREQEHDEADGDALEDEPRALSQGQCGTMKTGVPISTFWNSHSASGMRMRMHPCEAE